MPAIEPVRILELRSTYKWGGGPDKTILLSAARHDPARFDVRIVYLRGANDAEFEIGRRAASMGLEIDEIPERSKIDLAALRRIRAILREHRSDILHSHDYKTNLYAWLLRRARPGLSVMTTTHGWTRGGGKSRLYNWIDLRVLRRMTNIVAVSGATRRILLDAGVRPERIELIHNAIDERVWDPARHEPEYRRERGLSDDALLVGNVGRLSAEKDVFTWLEVAARVAARIPGARFVLVGEGALEAPLRARAAELGLTDAVHFAGFRRDLPAIYRSLDLHLMTSLTEGLPNTLLEAMAMGVPTVSTDVGGIAEIVRDGYNGLLLPARDVDGLTGGVLGLLEDPARRDALRRAGRETIEREFSFAARMRKIEDYYSRLAGRDVVAAPAAP